MIFVVDKKTLKPRKIIGNIILINSLIVMVSAFLAFAYGVRQGKNILQNLSPEEKLIILNDYDKFTPEKLKAYLNELNVPHADIVYAQSLIETGNFTSNIFRQNNNLFGMKKATIRPTTHMGEENGHAVYKNWRQSVIDYALYSSCYLTRLNREEYFHYLKDRYAEDPNYINKIKSILNK